MLENLSYQKAAKFYFALGHQRRLRIIAALHKNQDGLTFEQLEVLTRIPHSSLSHHLRILTDAHLIGRRIKDRFSIYRLERTPNALALPVF
jgi:DNA-binding transcriptional ArsR family regulator